MKIQVIGCSTIAQDPPAPCSSFLLEHNGQYLLIDVGMGALQQLLRSVRNVSAIRHVFLSHYDHLDHSGDLPNLLWHIYYLNRRKSLPTDFKITIYGPSGLSAFMDRIFGLWPALGPLRNLIIPREATGNLIHSFPGVEISAFYVSHGDVPANGLAIHEQGRTLFAYTGDTTKFSGLEVHIGNANLLIADCSYTRRSGVRSRSHMNAMELGELAACAGVRCLGLSHIYPPVEHDIILEEVRSHFAGQVIFLEQGMEISL